MNGPVKVTINEQGLQVVSARELYDFLGVKAQFTNWCNRMFAYGFEDGKDFLTILLESTGGRPTTDYALTLDCAKEIAMIQRTEKGKQARQYFIECEKLAKQTLQQAATTAPAQLSRKELALMVIQIEEEKERLEKQLIAAQPKIEYVDEVLDTADCVATTVIANELGYSATRFNKLLKEKGVQWKVDGVWVLTTKYAGRGYSEMRTHVYYDNNNQRHAKMYMVWTQRGRAFLHHLLKKQSA